MLLIFISSLFLVEPRKEIKIHEQILNKVFRTVKNHGSTFDIVGSYRRGKKTSGDIDVIISDPKNDSYVLKFTFKNWVSGKNLTL